MPSHFHIGMESIGGITGAQIGLKQALVSVRVHLQPPFVDQTQAPFQVVTAAKQPDQDVDRGDRPTHFEPFQLGEDRPDQVEPVGRRGFGEDKE